MAANLLTLGTSAIRQNGDLFSLNDLHRAAGGEAKHEPNQFTRLDQTRALIEEIKSADSRICIKTQRGAHGGTYASRELVIAYAAWISPAFHLKVIRVFLDAATPAQQALPYSVQPGQTLSAEQADTLRAALNTHASKMPPNEQGRFLREGWSKLKAHFKTDYRHIPANQFTDAMSIVARHCEGNTLKPAGPLSTPEQLIEAWFAPNGYHFDTEFLHRLATVCHERIFTAYQFQRSRASGQPVNVQWAGGLSGEMTH